MSSTLFASSLPALLRASSTTPTRHFTDYQRWSDRNTPPVLQMFCNQSIMQMCRAYYQGELCLLKGFNRWEGLGLIVCNENISKAIILDDTRRVGGAIVFNDGTRAERSDCWVLGYDPLVNLRITRRRVRNIDISGVNREESVCPVCLEDLSGVVVKCQNAHSVCADCHHKLVSPKKCPTCRGDYSPRSIVSTQVQNGFRNHDAFLGTLSRCMRGEIGSPSLQEKIISEAFWFYCLNDGHRSFTSNLYEVLKPINLNPHREGWSLELPDAESVGSVWEEFAIWFWKDGRERVERHIFNLFEADLRDDDMIDVLRRWYGAEEALNVLQQNTRYEERYALRRKCWVKKFYDDMNDYNAHANVVRLLRSALERVINALAREGEHQYFVSNTTIEEFSDA